MPRAVLEITQLEVKPAYSPRDKELLVALKEARYLIKTHAYNTQSRFYQEVGHDERQIYILGFWPTIEAHHEFLQSEHRSACLDFQEELFLFKRGFHVFVDLEVPFEVKYVQIATGDFEKLDNMGSYLKGLTLLKEPILDGGNGEGVLITGSEEDVVVEDFRRGMEALTEGEISNLLELSKSSLVDMEIRELLISRTLQE